MICYFILVSQGYYFKFQISLCLFQDLRIEDLGLFYSKQIWVLIFKIESRVRRRSFLGDGFNEKLLGYIFIMREEILGYLLKLKIYKCI